ncbi:MAG TPA: hypothetical protein DIC60_07950 [Lachnospiraceae bacterium]|nr:hypothetical protein [Lachnospiraceae bacterium]
MDYKKLVVQMLGGFSMTYDGKPVSLERSTVTNATQLLQYFIYYRDKKIPKDALINMLYNEDDITNPTNNLKVNLFRLRKILAKSHLPNDNYISFKSGMYSFCSQIPIELDVEQFNSFANQAENPDISDEEKIILLQRAIEVYKGEFLPMIINEPWVLVENLRYHDLFTKCINDACHLLKKMGDSRLMLDICNRAVHIYPLDEDMHLLRIECLLDMKRYNDALAAYDETTTLFFEKLGVSPSQKMLSLYKQLTNNVQLKTSTITQIKETIKEIDNPNGAYYCNYLGFVDSYRFISRAVERNGQSIFLSLFTLTNVKGEPLEAGEKLKESAAALHDAICETLRRGDLYTRYSPNQFLVLLIGINYENCSVVSNRIITCFHDEKRVRGVRLQHSATSGANINTIPSNIKFSGSSIW